MTAWPAPPDEAVYQGLLGEIVDALEPYTEADGVAVLTQLLTMCGIAAGLKPHFVVGSTWHRPRLFAAIVGPTSSGRKGQSGNDASHVMSRAGDRLKGRIRSGIASGEAVINEVRDPVEVWDEKAHTMAVKDPGAADKRLLIREPELARILRSMSRQGNVTSAVLRDAWDQGDLMVTARQTGIKATGAHIGLIGHITPDELRRELADVEAVNGFANRILWIASRRSKFLPEPEPVGGKVNALAIELGKRLEAASQVEAMERSEEAAGLWRAAYRDLVSDRPGLAGAICARAEAQALRISMTYALVDGSARIEVEHLSAALALQAYSERTVDFIFGDSVGDPVADRVMEAVRDTQAATGHASTRTDLFAVLGRNVTAGRLDQALELLTKTGRLRSQTIGETGGRPRVEYYAVSSSDSFSSSSSTPSEVLIKHWNSTKETKKEIPRGGSNGHGSYERNEVNEEREHDLSVSALVAITDDESRWIPDEEELCESSLAVASMQPSRPAPEVVL